MGGSFNMGSSEQSNKSVNRFEFPYQLFSGLNRTIGRPLSLEEIFTTAPGGRAGRGLFGGPQGAGRGLGFNLPGQSQTPTQPTTPGAESQGGLGFTGPNAPQAAAGTEPIFTANDLIGVVSRVAPDKAGDIGRLMEKGGLDPEGFTIAELEAAWNKFGKSTGNSKAVAAALLGTLADARGVEQSYRTNRFARGGI